VMDSVYLGYSNPRKAYVLRGHDIVVLKDVDAAVVLQGKHASEFIRSVSDLTHHTCGVRKTETARALLESTGGVDEAYNFLFNTFFSKGKA
jgi:hypothetical protein